MMRITVKGKTYEYDKKWIMLNATTHKRLKDLSKSNKMTYDKILNKLFDQYQG